MNCGRNGIVLSLIFLGIGAAAASDWPTFKQDTSRVGRTADPLSAPLTLRWVYSASEAPQLAWPGPGGKVIERLHILHRMRFDDVFHTVIATGKAIFGSSVDNHVYAYDCDSGKLLWSFPTNGPVRLAPTVADDKVYVGSDDGFAYCLNASDGGLIWKLRAAPFDERILARGQMSSRWPVRTSVLVDEGVAYFGAGTFPHENVYLIAADAETGDRLWLNDRISQRDAGRSDFTPQGYLLASKDQLFVPSGRTLPAAFDRSTGELVYKQLSGGKQIGGTQNLLIEDQLYTIGEHNILTMGQTEGTILGKLPAQQITFDGDIAFLATGKEISAVDHVQYTHAYQDEATKQKFNAIKEELSKHLFHELRQQYNSTRDELGAARSKLKLLIEDGDAGIGKLKTLQDKITAGEAKLAKLKPTMAASLEEYNTRRLEAEPLVGVKWRTPSSHESALILSGNTLVAGGEGQVIALDAVSGEIVWEADVEGEVRGLASADGYLLVSTTAGKVYCFGDARHATHEVVNHSACKVDNPYPQDEFSAMYTAAANSIIKETGITRGFCLVVGSEEGRLAYELARRTELDIYCFESDANKVKASRKALADTGLYGSRVTVEQGDLSVLPYPNYFANLIVSDTLLKTGEMPGNPQRIVRHLKPIGGIACLGLPDEATVDDRDVAIERVTSWIASSGLAGDGAETRSVDDWHLLTRGPLPGAAAWTHEYGNSGNTASVDDRRIRGGLSVLWYGDPGPSKMVNRHAAAAAPVSINGRLFVQGDTSIMAYDAYNGLFLWELENPGATRMFIKRGHEPGNLIASEDSVFNVVDDECWHIDAATGQILRRYKIPDSREDRQWGYVAYADGRLFGTSGRRVAVLPKSGRRRQPPPQMTDTDRLFAIDTTSEETLWTYEGGSISHTAVGVGDGRIFFIDSSITPEQREEMLRQDKTELKELTGEARQIAEDRLKRIDARLAIALDAQTGELLWSKPVDVTDCTGVGPGAGSLSLMYQGGYVVLGGANANGHFWDQFLDGEFKRRRLVVLSASQGYKLWAKDANYRHRPIILGDRIIAEPWAYDLESGDQITRTHPLTGEETAWKFIRPGHHCGAISASSNMLFFRSRYTGYYDLETDSGVRHFGGHRLGCWINMIPANGLVLIPEASAGCACLFSLTSTVVFEPREDRQTWGIYSAEGVTTPVRQIAINLGGPGDRRDAHGKLWLGYPRPSSRRDTNVPLNIEPQFYDGGGYVSHNSESFQVAGAEPDWVCASGVQGLKRCSIPLIDKGQSPSTYTVKLHFVMPSKTETNEQALEFKLQDKTALPDRCVVASEPGPQRAVMYEFVDVAVSEKLSLELIPGGEGSGVDGVLLSAVEVVESDARKVVQ